MATLREDTTGQIELGLFFKLNAYPIADAWSNYSAALVNLVNGVNYLHHVELNRDGRCYSSGRCTLHPSKEDSFRLRSLLVDVYGSDGDGTIIGGLGSELIVAPRVFTRLADAKLSGARFLPIEINYNNSIIDPTAHRALCFDGPDVTRPEVIDPPHFNHCLKCGFGPIVCDQCGLRNYSCPVCDAQLIYIDFPGREPVISEVPVKLCPDNGMGPIVSLDRWDGSDFLRDRIVTGRVVDVLFALEPKVLCAQALRCHLGQRQAVEYDVIRSKLFSNSMRRK